MTMMTTPRLKAAIPVQAQKRSIRTMQDLLDALGSLGYSKATLNQIRPRVAESDNFYKQPLHRIPADLAAFEERWGRGRIGALAAGFKSQKHFLEWRRRVRQALAKTAGPMPTIALLPEWEDLASWVEENGGPGRPLGPHQQHGLRALGDLASPAGLCPANVTAGWIATATKPLKRGERRTVKGGIATLAFLVGQRDLLPVIAHLLPLEPPEQPARVKAAPSPWRRGGPRASATLWQDFDAFVIQKRGVDDLGRPVPPEMSDFGTRTAETYATAVAQALALLERFGHLSSQATPRLTDLCTTDHITRVANAWQTRAIDGEVRADATTRHLMVERLIHIAEQLGHQRKKDRKELAKVREKVRKATTTRNRMSPPRLTWIKAFGKSPVQQRAVHLMPERLMREAQPVLDRWDDRKKRPSQKERMRALSLGIAAVMAAILFRGSAMRAKNLRGLRHEGPDAQLFLDPESGDVTLSIPGALVKNGYPIESEFDPDARPVIDWYLKEIRPRLIDDHPYCPRIVDSDYLFPSTRPDQPLDETSLAAHYAKGVEAVGLDMTLHQARHITVYLILSVDPSALKLASEALGDSVATVIAHYAWIDGVKANKEARAILREARNTARKHRKGSYNDE